MGEVLSCSIANRYSQKIWVKYDVENKYVEMEDFTVEGQVGVAGMELGASVARSKTYNWNKIEAKFTPVNPGDFKELSIDCKGEKVMFVTIIAEDDEIICNSLSLNYKNLVVTEDAQLREADKKQIMKVHKRYDPIDMRMSLETRGRMQEARDNQARKPNENSFQKVDSKSKRSEKQAQLPRVNSTSADERTTKKPRRCITNLSTKKLETITINSKDDKKDCDITGMALTNYDTILLADSNNDNIKSVSSDNKVLSVLSLPSEPISITVLDTTTAAVAAQDKKLYIVNISDTNTLSLRSKTKLEYSIQAMISYNSNIVATCYTEPWTIKLITIKGEVLWSVAVGHSGRQLFTTPYGITKTTIKDSAVKGSAVVVVSDFSKNTLTVLEAETGRYIMTIDLGEKKGPWGITVDNDGNVYVCNTSTREIGVWSNDFKKSKILVSRDKLGEDPLCIVYSAVDDSLYVSYLQMPDSGNTVDRFRLV